MKWKEKWNIKIRKRRYIKKRREEIKNIKNRNPNRKKNVEILWKAKKNNKKRNYKNKRYKRKKNWKLIKGKKRNKKKKIIKIRNRNIK